MASYRSNVILNKKYTINIYERISYVIWIMNLVLIEILTFAYNLKLSQTLEVIKYYCILKAIVSQVWFTLASRYLPTYKY